MTPADLAELREQWRRLVAQVGRDSENVDSIFDELQIRYGEPARHYHNLVHIRCVLADVQVLAAPLTACPALFFAAWLHDLVYDPRSESNEAQSAVLATEWLAQLGVEPGIVSETTRLIQLTKYHEPSLEDREGQVLVDADLAILGAASSVYDWYAAAIRQEYSWVADDDYRAGRARVLARFLARPNLFATAAMRTRAEWQARENLQRELNQLRR